MRTRACDTSHILPAQPRRPTECPLRALLQAVTVFTPPRKGVFTSESRWFENHAAMEDCATTSRRVVLAMSSDAGEATLFALDRERH